MPLIMGIKSWFHRYEIKITGDFVSLEKNRNIVEDSFTMCSHFLNENQELILPGKYTPVFTTKGKEEMLFSLIPSWSKTKKIKFATHNARIETIHEKATWKRPFLKNHCLVPLSSFIEPIYEGTLGGNMVRFDGHETLLAAGIYDSWHDPDEKKEIHSFAIITQEPCSFVKDTGHDRQPIFLERSSAQKWLELNGSIVELKEFLLKHSIEPELSTQIFRPLKKKATKELTLF